MKRAASFKIWLVFAGAILLHALLWHSARDFQSRWIGVPPLPAKASIKSSTLGDAQFAFRSMGIMLQNLGDLGGRVTHFDEYNYPRLRQWFDLAVTLDRHSNFIPFLVANYYSATTRPENIRPLVYFLDAVGRSEEGEKWRWSVRAIYLARYKAGDIDLAYKLALDLSARAKAGEMPAWTLQMPAFILNAKGEKEAAMALLLETLKSSADKMHPNEVRETHYYICTQLLSPQEALKQTFCQDVPVK